MAIGMHYILEAQDIGRLITSLQAKGYQVIGPKARDGAIVYEPLEGAHDLPYGWIDEESPAHYRLTKGGDELYFGYVKGAQSWKRFLHPPDYRLWAVKRANGSYELGQEPPAPQSLAFLGVRACELAAIGILDRVLLDGTYSDPVYRARRNGLFIVAVQCTRAGSTCFCTSMDTGPRVGSGADLILTELKDEEGHRFVVTPSTEKGAETVAEMKLHKALAKTVRLAESLVEKAAQGITRSISTAGLKEILYQNFEHPEWEQVARRCLACGNCTLSCPTCFCVTVEDTSNVSLTQAQRWRRWDSCFVQNFSYIHGGAVRMSPKSRYRQWMTHKLAYWYDQFGTSGCVGCGRCITWCPVGIDITQEVAIIRGETAGSQGGTDNAERAA